MTAVGHLDIDPWLKVITPPRVHIARSGHRSVDIYVRIELPADVPDIGHRDTHIRRELMLQGQIPRVNVRSARVEGNTERSGPGWQGQTPVLWKCQLRRRRNCLVQAVKTPSGRITYREVAIEPIDILRGLDRVAATHGSHHSSVIGTEVASAEPSPDNCLREHFVSQA